MPQSTTIQHFLWEINIPMYNLSQPFLHRLEVMQGSFLSRVLLVWIQFSLAKELNLSYY